MSFLLRSLLNLVSQTVAATTADSADSLGVLASESVALTSTDETKLHIIERAAIKAGRRADVVASLAKAARQLDVDCSVDAVAVLSTQAALQTLARRVGRIMVEVSEDRIQTRQWEAAKIEVIYDRAVALFGRSTDWVKDLR